MVRGRKDEGTRRGSSRKEGATECRDFESKNKYIAKTVSNECSEAAPEAAGPS